MLINQVPLASKDVVAVRAKICPWIAHRSQSLNFLQPPVKIENAKFLAEEYLNSK